MTTAAWIGEWALLSARIDALGRAAELAMESLNTASTDNSSVMKNTIALSIVDVTSEMGSFLMKHKPSLPEGATKALERLVQASSIRIGADQPVHYLRVAAAVLATASEVNFYLGDPQVAGARLTERAFLHLNRSLVVDGGLRQKWKDSFDNSGETACEKLGAVHLLSHGIFAFKVSGAGAATDIVLSERLAPTNPDVSLAEYLVLTEWKVIREESDVVSVAAGARSQAADYAAGLLGGVELRVFRYIVLVSEKKIIDLPADVPGTQPGVTFRHINVVIGGETPSAAGARVVAAARPAPAP